MSRLQKTYQYINITIGILGIYILLYPFFVEYIQKIIPNFGICPYLAITGQPCPLCGGTRYIKGWWQGGKDISYLMHPFGIILLVVILEILLRIGIFFYYKKSKKISISFIKIDMIIHLGIAIAFFLYEVFYFF